MTLMTKRTTRQTSCHTGQAVHPGTRSEEGQAGTAGQISQSDFSPAPESGASEAGARLCFRTGTPRPPFSEP